MSIEVYKNIDTIPKFPNTVLTIGTFDGVHQAHQEVIKRVVAEAEQLEGTPTVITFYPHPREALPSTDSRPLALLTEPNEKFELFDSLGIKVVAVVNFDADFYKLSAEDYIEKFLFQKFYPKKIIIGFDHRFGFERKGDFTMLQERGLLYGYAVEQIPQIQLDAITISSTKIRAALIAGDIETANDLLGYNYFFTGTVVHGNKMGRTIGFPTANLSLEHQSKLMPGNGVYSVDVRYNHALYKGMMNIGYRPTVDGINRTIEVHLFDFDKEIYGEKLKVTIKKKLRNEHKFASIDELKTQLSVDKANALEG